MEEGIAMRRKTIYACTMILAMVIVVGDVMAVPGTVVVTAATNKPSAKKQKKKPRGTNGIKKNPKKKVDSTQVGNSGHNNNASQIDNTSSQNDAVEVNSPDNGCIENGNDILAY